MVLPGAVLEKSAATWFSTGTWVGSWPVPRQQYQRSEAGGNENGVSVASGASLTAVVGAAPDGAELDVVDGLQAEAMKIAAPSRPRILGGLVRTGSSFSISRRPSPAPTPEPGWRRTGRGSVRRSSGCGHRARTSGRTRPGRRR